MLSNADLLPLLRDEEPLVRNVKGLNEKITPQSPLQPASIDLHVGEIVVPPTSERSRDEAHPLEKYVVPSGGSIVVLTEEIMCFSREFGGLMFPKSSRLAERGILLTNFGHVDPGYQGRLRYAVVNLGREPYEVRCGDAIASLCVFRLHNPASPDWSTGREIKERRTQDFVRALSPDLLSLARIESVAKDVAQKAVLTSSLWITLVATIASVCVGVVSAAITLGVAWYQFGQPEIARLEAQIQTSRPVAQTIAQPHSPPAQQPAQPSPQP